LRTRRRMAELRRNMGRSLDSSILEIASSSGMESMRGPGRRVMA